MAEEKDLKLEEAAAPEPKGKKKLLFIIIGALVVIGIAVGITLFLIMGDAGGGSDEEAEASTETATSTKAPAQYIKLKPEFVVNFQVGPRQRFLQVFIEVMTRNGAVASGLEEHSPRIRSEIIRVISQNDFEQLRTAEGRSALQAAIADVLKQIMREEIGTDEIEQVLFTNYVMQ